MPDRLQSFVHYEWMQWASWLCLGLVIILPVYLVFFRRRFWFGFFAMWFFLVAGSSFSIYHGLYLLELGFVESAADTTEIGLTVFSGWILSLFYCGILLIGRLFFDWVRGFRKQKGEQCAAAESDRAGP
ncbi:hypothetical protein [Roseibacillus persicicus]|uniref:hypothetical protein n=1 Tax=Roseibacillus persicicus TaxID=454148 RepID=UPI00280DFCCB|nr:hypothetical protein [Roseibacillus persicicus]MDQ8192670.1 hypothetical protein [Roseibacillus persicicus]